MIFLLILGTIKSSYLGAVKRKEKNKEEAERKKEENKRKKIEKELHCIKKKNIKSWSSESDLDDDDEEDEVEDEYRQEEESSEDLQEKVNHVELGVQHSPTKNPKKQKIKKLIFFPFYVTYICIQVLWKYHFPLVFDYTFELKHFWT